MARITFPCHGAGLSAVSYDSFRNIEIQHLEGLIALVEAGSFTKAAGRLFISQSALTKQIKNMEDAAGAKLISRTPAGLHLTQEGRIVYDYARRVIRLREETKERVAKLKNKKTGGHIYVSASNIPATYMLPWILQQLRRGHPDINVHTQMHDSEEALQIILNNQAEIGFIGKEAYHKRLVSERLWKDELVVVMASGNPIAERRCLTVEDLASLPFVIREYGSGTRQITEDRLQDRFGTSLTQFNVICEMGSSEAVKETVLAGLGVSIISRFSIKRELEAGLLAAVGLKDCRMERFFYLIYKKDLPLEKHHLLFLDAVKKYKPC